MRLAAMRQPSWLALAWAELGQREIPGPASNPRIVEYIRRVGHPNLANDSTPWCAAFVGACLERAGHASTRSLRARSYLDWGRAAGAEADLGAIAVLSRGANPALGHVGFLVGLTPEHAILLGGNQSNAVTVAAFARSRLLGLRMPGAVVPADSSVARDSASTEPGTFAWSLARILELEGGYTEDPFDPGGPTNKGITLAVWARELGEEVSPANYARLKASLRTIPDAMVERIYRQRYWTPARCPDLPVAIAHFHFDAAVNQGVGTAARMLQEALGVVVDGRIGPQTLGAASRQAAPGVLARYAAIRRRRYRALHHFWRFGRGWLARVDRVLAQAERLASAPATPSPPATSSAPATTAAAGNPAVLTREGPAPAAAPATTAPVPQETDPMPDSQIFTDPAAVSPRDSKWWGNSLTVWGALVTAASTVLPSLLAVAGIDVPAALIGRLGQDVAAVAQALGGLIGTVMTIAGRVRAREPLARRAVAIRL